MEESPKDFVPASPPARYSEKVETPHFFGICLFDKGPYLNDVYTEGGRGVNKMQT